MKHFLAATLLGLSLSQAGAQVKDFTYQSDRTVKNAHDLYGMTFVPGEGKLSSAHYPQALSAGQAQFKFESTTAYIKESVKFTPAGLTKIPEQSFKLNIPTLNQTNYGYEIVLMDYQNPNIQGYIKVYVDNATKFVTSLAFKPTEADQERVYFINKIPKETDLRDGKFFTHNQDLVMTGLDDFWGKTLYPFASFEHKGEFYYEFNRIYPKDRIAVGFEERMEKTPNGKKEKLVQYVMLKKGTENGDVIIDEYSVRKTGSGSFDRHKNFKVPSLMVEVLDVNQNKSVIHFLVSADNYLQGVVWPGKLDGSTNTTIYEMRVGKRIDR